MFKRMWRWLDDRYNYFAMIAIAILSATVGLMVWRPKLLFHPATTLQAVVSLLTAIACLTKWRHARWLCVACLVTLLAHVVTNEWSGGWRWHGIVAAISLTIYLAYVIWDFFFRPAREENSDRDTRPLLSLVLLFRELPYLDAQVLASIAKRAWGIEFSSRSDEDEGEDDPEQAASPEGEDEEPFIVGSAPLFFAKHPEAFMLLHVFDRPYFDDQERVAQSVPELRIRQALLEHRGWVAVDVLHWLGPEEDLPAAYRLIARFLAELADDNVLAVLDPAAESIFPYDPETERKLRSADACAELRERYYAPVLGISGDDPAMIAAVAEARQRWPEFVAAFENRAGTEEEHFAVKAPFGQGDDVEFMWLEVTGIEHDLVLGRLGNEPMHGPLKIGDRVRVAVGEINDWMYVAGGDPVGGFTVKVLVERSRQADEGKPGKA